MTYHKFLYKLITLLTQRLDSPQIAQKMKDDGWICEGYNDFGVNGLSHVSEIC